MSTWSHDPNSSADQEDASTGEPSLQEAMANALGGYISEDTVKLGAQYMQDMHSTVNENTSLLYVFWILIVVFAFTGFACMWCWLMKRAIRWLAVVLLVFVACLLVIDIALRVKHSV